MTELGTLTRKERRRLRAAAAGKAMNKMADCHVEKVELLSESQSSDKLFRCDTYVLSKTKSDDDAEPCADDASECLNLSSVKEDESESSGRTYNVSQKSDQDTYKVVRSKDLMETRPVPAPRRTKSSLTTSEKMSLDTDRDVAELELDDLSPRNKSETDSKSLLQFGVKGETNPSASDESIVVPVPKPRKRINISNRSDVPQRETDEKSKDQEKDPAPDADPVEPTEEKQEAELPVMKPLEYALKSKKEIQEVVKKEKKLNMADLIKKKAPKESKKFKSGKMLSSIMKLEKTKIPKIATILKDLKDSEKKEENENVEDLERLKEDADIADFQIDSPRYPESEQNKQIYVQDKNGFNVMNREEVLKSVHDKYRIVDKNRKMANSTVKTAVLFQMYWSKTMMYFHGIVAGFAFGHTAMITAVVMHLNYNAREFINVYSRLSLKIHYIFYTLTTFCIVSCFDRIDIGHINKKHWKAIWRNPSMWMILLLYAGSFALTFVNQKNQARFDAYSYVKGNDTDLKIWGTKVPNEIEVSFLAWFHTIRARDVLLLVAWLMISLTEFSDSLWNHLNNMMKYSDVENGAKS